MKLRPRGTMSKCVPLQTYFSDWSLKLNWERVNGFRIGQEYKDLWSQPGLDLSPGCALIVLGLSFLICKMRQVILHLRIVVGIRYEVCKVLVPYIGLTFQQLETVQ